MGVWEGGGRAGGECFFPLTSWRSPHHPNLLAYSRGLLPTWPLLPPTYTDPCDHIEPHPDNPGSPSLDPQLHDVCKVPSAVWGRVRGARVRADALRV